MNISLKQLEVFVTIVECGNFTEAGKRLYLAQSTVSSHITALEETLRVSLFRRESKRTIELTADGKRVYQYAKDVVSKCNILEEASALEERRELVIGASPPPPRACCPSGCWIFSEPIRSAAAWSAAVTVSRSSRWFWTAMCRSAS